MKIPHSCTDVGATGRSPARGHGCGRPAGRPYENFHSQWRAAGSWKLCGEYRFTAFTTETQSTSNPMNRATDEERLKEFSPEARGVIQSHWKALETSPCAFRPLLIRQLRAWEGLFPPERESLTRILGSLASL